MSHQMQVLYTAEDFAVIKDFLTERNAKLWYMQPGREIDPSNEKLVIMYISYPTSNMYFLDENMTWVNGLLSDIIEIDGGHKAVYGMDNIPCYRSGRIYIASEKCKGENNKWLMNEYSLLCKYIRKKACSVQTIGRINFYILENASKLINEYNLPIS